MAASPTVHLPDPDAAAPNMDPEYGFTAQDLIEQQERLEAQANEAIPYSVDECTHAQGYIRQLVYACKTCGGGGVCVGCSVLCHADHDLVELFHRRHFRCDCGTPNMYRCRPPSPHMDKTGYPKDASPCQLRLSQPSKGWDVPNDENRYTRNFAGEFCVCERGRHYDPETESEDMFQCLVCEEWLHESCTSLVQNNHRMLNQSQFDTIICDACVRAKEADLLRSYIGQRGWMVVLPPSDAESWRLLEPQDIHTTKRTRLDPDSCKCPAIHAEVKRLLSTPHRMDVFLAPNFRDTLCRCAQCTTAWQRYPYVLDEEETYEPPELQDDTTSATSTSSTYDRAVAALKQLPRTQMIESLYAYQSLRDALFEHLRPYAESHEPVSEETVRAFFREQTAAREARR